MNLLNNHEHLGIQLKEEWDHEVDSYFADDTTIIAGDIGKAHTLFNLVQQNFCKGSGAQLHPDKTVLMPITLHPIPYSGHFRMLNPSESTRVLGIPMGINDIMTNSQHRFDGDIGKIVARLKKWINRGRTLRGRVIIIRSLIQSYIK